MQAIKWSGNWSGVSKHMEPYCLYLNWEGQLNSQTQFQKRLTKLCHNKMMKPPQKSWSPLYKRLEYRFIVYCLERSLLTGLDISRGSLLTTHQWTKPWKGFAGHRNIVGKVLTMLFGQARHQAQMKTPWRFCCCKGKQKPSQEVRKSPVWHCDLWQHAT